jgi:hypothetical protein
MEDQDGVLENGELQPLLGLEACSAKQPVAELTRQNIPRLDLDWTFRPGARTDVHLSSSDCMQDREHLPHAASSDSAKAPVRQSFEWSGERLHHGSLA